MLRRRLKEKILTLGPFTFDFSGHWFLREGRPIKLSRVEGDLLRLLVENRGRTVERDTLLQRIWDTSESVDANTLSVAVRRLREKLGEAPITTVYGVGYRWEG